MNAVSAELPYLQRLYEPYRTHEIGAGDCPGVQPRRFRLRRNSFLEVQAARFCFSWVAWPMFFVLAAIVSVAVSTCIYVAIERIIKLSYVKENEDDVTGRLTLISTFEDTRTTMDMLKLIVLFYEMSINRTNSFLEEKCLQREEPEYWKTDMKEI